MVSTHMDSGGIGVYILNLALDLKKMGEEVIVVSSGGKYVTGLKNHGIKHIYLDIKTKNEFGFKVIKAIPVLRKLLKEENVDIVHSHTRVSSVLTTIVAKLAKIQHVTTCHGFYQHTRLSRKLFPCWGDKVVAISNEVEKHMLEDFNYNPENVRCIRTGISLDRLVDVPKDEFLVKSLGLENKIIVGMIGRFSSVKGHKYLMNAFSIINKKYDNCKLLFVGNKTKYLEELKKTAKNSMIDNDVVFLDSVDKPIAYYYSLIDIFCMPSLEEGLGLALMEAMASECACVANNTGGLKELIDDSENGILLNTEDAVKFAEVLEGLLTDEKRMRLLALAAKEKAIREFSSEISSEGILEFYKAKQ